MSSPHASSYAAPGVSQAVALQYPFPDLPEAGTVTAVHVTTGDQVPASRVVVEILSDEIPANALAANSAPTKEA